MSSKVVIYHNPRCQKSRNALNELEALHVEADVVEYLKEKLSVNELKELCVKLGIKPSELVRKNEALYKEKYKNKVLSEEQWLEILVESPSLIQRPIVVKGKKALIAREEGLLKQFLK
jgi:arsenate reductase